MTHPKSSPVEPGRMLSADFAPLLTSFDLDVLDAHDSTIYGIHNDLTIGYANSAWMRFAMENAGAESLCDPENVLGSNILDQISGPLRSYYRELFCGVLRMKKTANTGYECSSPTIMRYYHMEVLTLPTADADPRGLLIINSRKLDPVGHSEPRAAVTRAQPRDYINDHGYIVNCSNCRRFQRADQPHTWEWVPAYLNAPPADVSHGLCSICLDYYFPASR